MRIIAFGFFFAILIGSLLLMMPFCIKDDVTLDYIDSLYTAASAVCVTGLVTVDVGSTFTPIGQTIVAILIQIGGLGVTTFGTGIMLALGKKISLKEMFLVKEASNLNSGKGLIHFIRNIFLVTFIIEGVGALLSFTVFIQDLPWPTALGVSVFHSIASFNNSGFDVLGGLTKSDGTVIAPFSNLISYQNNPVLNFTTIFMILLGGIGFLVIREVLQKRFSWKKFSMHTKVVLSMTSILLIAGTLLLKLTEDIPWMGALFTSVSTRTAGFSAYPLGSFSMGGLLIVAILMVIGASPGSTGGGIKTTTFFALLQGMKSSATNRSEKAFKFSMPKNSFRKAAVITIFALFIILIGTYLILVFDAGTVFPEHMKNSGETLTLSDALTEIVSAFATVGLSTGITPYLSTGSKIISIMIMFIGRLGPLTVATLWYFSKGERFAYPEGNIAIG